MASNNVIFDPDSGVPFAVNLSLYGGADFVSNLNVKNTSNNNFDLTGYSGSASISKSVAVGATLGITTNLTVGFTSAFDGKIFFSMLFQFFRFYTKVLFCNNPFHDNYFLSCLASIA